MLLAYADGRPYAAGAIHYDYRPATPQDTLPRIVLSVSFENLETEAVLDTGAPFVVCAPDLALLLHLDPSAGAPTPPLEFRGHRLRGGLHRISLSLLADLGDSLTVEATAFVPDLDPGQQWGEFPSFLGMSGFLERLRFAVDPSSDTFYFGPLSEN
jgi:hypothetical protein